MNGMDILMAESSSRLALWSIFTCHFLPDLCKHFRPGERLTSVTCSIPSSSFLLVQHRKERNWGNGAELGTATASKAYFSVWSANSTWRDHVVPLAEMQKRNVLSCWLLPPTSPHYQMVPEHVSWAELKGRALLIAFSPDHLERQQLEHRPAEFILLFIEEDVYPGTVLTHTVSFKRDINFSLFITKKRSLETCPWFYS
jgi:hypothetical protein